MYTKIRTYSKIFLIIFVPNFIWEISQMSFYAPHYSGLLEFLSVHVRATLGDVVIIGVGYLFGIVLFRDLLWVKRCNVWVIVYCICTGFFLAVVIEKAALVSGRWSYNDMMPLVPVLKVGLMPIMQMVILPVVIIFLTKILLLRSDHGK